METAAERNDPANSDPKNPQECHILLLPHCVLLTLLSYLDASALFSLGQTCKLLFDVVKHPRLWRCIDARGKPHHPSKFSYCCRRMHRNTTHFLALGVPQTVLSVKFFVKINCYGSLKVLSLECQTICTNSYSSIDALPPTLEELSLKRTDIESGVHFLNIVLKCEKLKVLIVDLCAWLTFECLRTISRISPLETLSLYLCKQLSERDFAALLHYEHFALPNLKILNVRFTGAGNALLSLLHARSPKLQELYFQCYYSTYHLERTRRWLAKLHEDSAGIIKTIVDDKAEFCVVIPHGGDVLLDVLTDSAAGLFERNLGACNLKCQPPGEGVLFEPPYSTRCTCGFYQETREEDFHQRKFSSTCLRRLGLKGYRKVTDATLHCLDNVRLELLDVCNTGVTEEGVRYFMVMHPGCRVLHESACTCPPKLHF